MHLRIIATGGTIDTSYLMFEGRAGHDETHLPRMLQQGRCRLPVDVEVNRLVNSGTLTDADRQDILRAVRECPEERVVVTHGTDTMAETARVIGGAGLEKTVVMTGAMLPYVVEGSDALFNLGFTVAAAQTLPHGTYVAMNGRIFPWDDVCKDRERGVFENL